MSMVLDRPMSEETAARAAFHDERLRYILGLPDPGQRGEAATSYVTWLDACRVEASAIRLVEVHKLRTQEGLGALRIANILGLQKARGQQLINEAAVKYHAASQTVAAIRRRLGRSG